MKRMIACALIFLLCLAPSCASEVEIMLLSGWGTMENEHIAMREIYRHFEEIRPDVKLTLVSLPDTEQALAKAGDMLSAGEAPDILFVAGVHSALIDFMIDKGYALNLMPYLQKDAEFLYSVSPITLRTWQTDTGALYTLTDVLWLNGLWLNETLFHSAGIEDAPQTWTQFFLACDRIAAWSEANGQNVKPLALTIEDAANLLQFIVAGMGETGPAGESARLVDALSLLEKLFTYTGAQSVEYQYRDTLSLFNQEQTVFYVNGIWASGMIYDHIDAVCVAFPGESGSVSGQSVPCGYILGNTGDEARMEASVAFVKYMLSEQTQAKILTSTGQFPSNPNLAYESIAGVTPRFVNAVTAMRNAERNTGALWLMYDETAIEQIEGILFEFLRGNIPISEAAVEIGAIKHR